MRNPSTYLLGVVFLRKGDLSQGFAQRFLSKMSALQTSEKPLQPYVIDLSMLHAGPPFSGLPGMNGNDMCLANAKSTAVEFKAIMQDSTSDSLLLESFYSAHIAGKIVGGVTCPKIPLNDVGISRVAFSTMFGKMHGQNPLRDQNAPNFKVKGMTRVPFIIQGYRFMLTCFILDHIFELRNFESSFPLVVGGKSLREYFLRGQWAEAGYALDLPPRPTSIDELIIYTDGCCLSNGQSEQNPARAGYGIHFPQLSRDWDFANPVSKTEKHTNQRAELLAVIRAMQLVQARSIRCKRISIFTDSMYAVQGLNEWIPKWRTNKYRTAQKKPVSNADLFKLLDQEVNKSKDQGIPVELSHVPREGNTAADTLARAGAVGSSNQSLVQSMTGGGGVLGRPLFEKVRPLVQWSPDGEYWARSADLPQAEDGTYTI